MNSEGEIILYQSEESTQLEVRIEDETVWLTQAQMVDLFKRDVSVISRHISNIFKEEELDKKSNLHFLQIAFSDKPIIVYSLDVIISVGYRVKSKRGTQFRIWANSILKEYLMKGYVLNHRIDRLEKKILEHDQKFDLLIKTSLPPHEGIFYDGQIFDAYKFAADLVKSAKKSIVLIDNYVDESVLLLFSKREKGVIATIYTTKISKELQLDIDKFNAQYEPVEVKVFIKSHDRFLIIDNEMVYHIGASLKDLAKKWFAFSKIELDANEMIQKIKN
ncbi:MAG: RhuM family protein [Paludibacter sp.]